MEENAVLKLIEEMQKSETIRKVVHDKYRHLIHFIKSDTKRGRRFSRKKTIKVLKRFYLDIQNLKNVYDEETGVFTYVIKHESNYGRKFKIMDYFKYAANKYGESLKLAEFLKKSGYEYKNTPHHDSRDWTLVAPKAIIHLDNETGPLVPIKIFYKEQSVCEQIDRFKLLVEDFVAINPITREKIITYIYKTKLDETEYYCEEYNTTFKESEVIIIGKENNFTESLLTTNVYCDDNFVKLSNIHIKAWQINGKIYSDNIDIRYVMNMNSGKTFLLPRYNLSKRKKERKKEGIRTISSFRRMPIIVNIERDLMIKVGKTIEEYNRKKGLDVIPFEKYAENINSYIYSNLHILVSYNTNPFISHKKLMAINDLKNNLKHSSMKIPGVKNISLYRNKDIATKVDKKINKFINKLKLESSLKKIAINYACLANNSNYVSFIETCEKLALIKEKTKDINNIIKFSKITGKDIYYGNFSDIVSIVRSTFYKDCVKLYGENKTINRIAKANNLCITRDTCEMYDRLKKYGFNMTIPKKFNVQKLHDEYSIDLRKMNTKKANYTYSKGIEPLNEVINNLTFTVAKSNYDLVECGSLMSICVGSYNRYVENGNKLIVFVKNSNDEYKVCIEISIKEKEIRQIKGICNGPITKEEEEAVIEWANKHNFKYATGDVYERVNDFTGDNKLCKVFKDYEITLTIDHKHRGDEKESFKIPF